MNLVLQFFPEFSFDDSGKSYCLENSDVIITTPCGTQGSLYTSIHTDYKPFIEQIPQGHCIISLVLDCHTTQGGNEKNGWFVLHIPHCLSSKYPLDYNSVTVQHGDIHTGKAFAKIPHCKDQTTAESWMRSNESCFFLVQADHILIYTQDFCQFICTICEKRYFGRHHAFVFGKLQKAAKSGALASVRVYACSPLYKIQDFRKVCQQVS